MAGREEMLERIRKALGRPPQGSEHAYQPEVPLPSPGPVVPPMAPEELLPKFEEELRKVSGCPYRVSNSGELDDTLRSILANSGLLILSRNPLLARLGLKEKLQAWGRSVVFWPEVGPDTSGVEQSDFFRKQCFSAAAGITGIDFALAETGSLVLSSVTEGSQLASLVPPIHVALYRRSQVVGSLEEVLERLPISRRPDVQSLGRSVVFITGTSRTADIEQVLVRGVHGPQEVHAILVEEACLASERDFAGSA